MSRLANLRIVDPVLTSLAVGYSNAETIGMQLFPFATVPKEAGKIPKHNKQAFKLAVTERALRAKSNRLDPEDRTWIDFTLDEHDISVPMDYRESEESDDLDVEAANTFLATEVLSLRHEKMCADLAFNPANYGAANKIALAGSDKFSDYNGSKPIDVIDGGIDAVRKQVARRPNCAAIGASAFTVIKNHPKVLERMAASQLGVVTPQLLAQILGLQDIYVGDAIYVSDDGATTTDMWNDSMLLYYRRPVNPTGKRSVYEPNYAYTVHRKETEVDKYDEEGGKLRNVRATHRFKPVLVGADAAYLISGIK